MICNHDQNRWQAATSTKLKSSIELSATNPASFEAKNVLLLCHMNAFGSNHKIYKITHGVSSHLNLHVTTNVSKSWSQQNPPHKVCVRSGVGQLENGFSLLFHNISRELLGFEKENWKEILQFLFPQVWCWCCFDQFSIVSHFIFSEKRFINWKYWAISCNICYICSLKQKYKGKFPPLWRNCLNFERGIFGKFNLFIIFAERKFNISNFIPNSISSSDYSNIA